jgi:hypothetical protein
MKVWLITFRSYDTPIIYDSFEKVKNYFREHLNSCEEWIKNAKDWYDTYVDDCEREDVIEILGFQNWIEKILFEDVSEMEDFGMLCDSIQYIQEIEVQ